MTHFSHIAAETQEVRASGALPSKNNQQPHRVRIGALSLFSLIIMISLAVLAVLAFTTANASLVMSQRQANAESDRYLEETAAQEFIAALDDVLFPIRQAKGSAVNDTDKAQTVVAAALEDLCHAAQNAAGGKVHASAQMEDGRVAAKFICGNGRLLNVEVSIDKDASYRIERWSTSAVQNQEPAQGQLLITNGSN